MGANCKPIISIKQAKKKQKLKDVKQGPCDMSMVLCMSHTTRTYPINWDANTELELNWITINK